MFANNGQSILVLLIGCVVSGCALDFDKFVSESSQNGVDVGLVDMEIPVDTARPEIDSDDDGVEDSADNCPAIENANQRDSDGDGQGDVCDDDRDGDRIQNDQDICPDVGDPSQSDLDSDGIGDACDSDLDGDGVENEVDACPRIPNPDQSDLDADGTADACDDDIDGDGLTQDQEAALGAHPFFWDSDADGIADNVDTCPIHLDSTNYDGDGDGLGRICDPDDDEDGVYDFEDNCPGTANPDQQDGNGNGVGDVCEEDFDGDGVSNADDSCPHWPNPEQNDSPCHEIARSWFYDRETVDLSHRDNGTYVTTRLGIYRIEGNDESRVVDTFKLFESQLTSVYPGDQGRLLLSSENAVFVLNEFTHRQFDLMNITAPTNFEGPFEEIIEYAGKIWVGTSQGVFRLDDEGWTQVEIGDAVTQINRTLEMVRGPGNTLWIVFADGVAIFDGERLICSDEGVTCPVRSLDITRLKGAFSTDSDSIWVFHDQGADKYNFAGLVQASFRGPEVFDLAGDQELLAIAPFNLYRVDGESRPLPISLRTFASSQLTSIIQEIDGTYLIGSVNGVQRHKGVISTYMQNAQQGIADLGPCVVDGLRFGGDLWIASRDRLTRITPTNEVESLTIEEINVDLQNLGEAPINGNQFSISAMQLIDDSIWLGTTHGILVYSPSQGSFLQPPAREQLPSAPITAVEYDSVTGRVWIGTQGGGIVHTSLETLRNSPAVPGWTAFSQDDGLPSGDVRALAIGNQRVYAATQGGTIAIDASTFLRDPSFGSRIEPLSLAGNDVAVDSASGRVFFATDNGLAVVSPDGQWEIFQQFDESAPLPDDPNAAFVGLPFAVDTNVVRSVTFDGEFMWLVMGRGQTRESADGTFVTINPAGSIVRRRPELSNEEGLKLWEPKDLGTPETDAIGGVGIKYQAGEIHLSVCGQSTMDEIPGGYSIISDSDFVMDRFSASSLVGFPVPTNAIMAGPEGSVISTGLDYEGSPISQRFVGNEWKTIELPYDDLGGVLKACALEPNAPNVLNCIAPRMVAEPPPSGGVLTGTLDQTGEIVWQATSAREFSQFKNGDLTSIVTNSAGVSWIGSLEGLIKYASAGTVIELISKANETELLSDQILALELHNDVLYLGTEQGLQRFSPAENEGSKWLLPSEQPANVRDLAVVDLAVNVDGSIFAATSSGLHKYDQALNYVGRDDRSTGLLSNEVTAVTTRSDGSVYVGSSGGLNLWDPETSTWKTVPLGYHLQGQRIEALLTTHSDEVWVRTSAGIARLID